MIFLNESQRSALADVSAALGVQPDSLSKLIAFESNWNPQAKNTASTAKGLIQFTDETAVGMGYTDSLELIEQNPTIESQLYGPVFIYLKHQAPFKDEGDLYMSVFYPAARYWSRERELPAHVQAVNPGIRTPQDYIDKVNRKTDYALYGLIAAALIGAFLIAYLQTKGS